METWAEEKCPGRWHDLGCSGTEGQPTVISSRGACTSIFLKIRRPTKNY